MPEKRVERMWAMHEQGPAQRLKFLKCFERLQFDLQERFDFLRRVNHYIY
jgi:hypothetical protein